MRVERTNRFAQRDQRLGRAALLEQVVVDIALKRVAGLLLVAHLDERAGRRQARLEVGGSIDAEPDDDLGGAAHDRRGRAAAPRPR